MSPPSFLDDSIRQYNHLFSIGWCQILTASLAPPSKIPESKGSALVTTAQWYRLENRRLFNPHLDLMHDSCGTQQKDLSKMPVLSFFLQAADKILFYHVGADLSI